MTGAARSPRDQFAEVLRAVIDGQVIDGVPVTSATIGRLMAAHADALADLIAGDDAGSTSGGDG